MNTPNKKQSNVHCDSCSLHGLCLPKGLNENELSDLDDFIERPHLLVSDAFVYKPKQKLKNLYAVRSGSVKTYLLDKNGGEQIIGFHLPGEVFGIDGMETKEHKCFAQTLEETSICELPYDKLTQIVEQVPRMQDQIFSVMSQEMNNDQSHLLLLGRQNSEEKLATFLLSLSSRFEQRGFSASKFNLSMSRQDIACFLGLTIETVSRLFRAFQNKGILAVDRRNISILDQKELVKLVEDCDSNSA